MCANITDTRGLSHVLAYKGEAALSTNQQMAVYLAPPLTCYFAGAVMSIIMLSKHLFIGRIPKLHSSK